MARTYGDPMAFSALASIQPDLTRADVSFLQLLFSGRFLVDRWTETWGEFGWRLVHLSPALTGTLGIVAALCMAGLIVEARRDRVVDLWTDWRAQALVLLGCACLLGYVATAQFGVRFVLTQARYFFSIVDAAALLLMLGLRTLIAPRWRPAAQAVVVFAAIAVTVVVYTAHVAPYWYFR
jgi:hypothetical protein